MKKIIFFFAAAALSFQAIAQPANPGFELVDDEGQPYFWKQALMLAFPIDTTCIGFGMDSLHFLTSDAHSGEHALEMRTASYCGTAYTGGIKPVKVNDDTDPFVYSGGSIPFLGPRPASCSFYYKLEAIGGDAGEMELSFSTEDGIPVGDAYINLAGSTHQWTKATVPITYYDEQAPTVLSMRFKIGNTEILHYGSRFLIDDVSFETQATGIGSPDQQSEQLLLTCYPVPAANELFLRVGQKMNAAQATILVTDASGRMVKQVPAVVNKNNTLRITVGDLAGGLYFVNVYSNGVNARGKFVK